MIFGRLSKNLVWDAPLSRRRRGRARGAGRPVSARGARAAARADALGARHDPLRARALPIRRRTCARCGRSSSRASGRHDARGRNAPDWAAKIHFDRARVLPELPARRDARLAAAGPRAREVLGGGADKWTASAATRAWASGSERVLLARPPVQLARARHARHGPAARVAAVRGRTRGPGGRALKPAALPLKGVTVLDLARARRAARHDAARRPRRDRMEGRAPGTGDDARRAAVRRRHVGVLPEREPQQKLGRARSSDATHLAAIRRATRRTWWSRTSCPATFERYGSTPPRCGASIPISSLLLQRDGLRASRTIRRCQATTPSWGLHRTGASRAGEADGPPIKVGVAVVDVLASMHAASAILAALVGRFQDAAARISTFFAVRVRRAFARERRAVGAQHRRARAPARQRHPTIVPYQTFAASDGSFVLAVGNGDGQWGGCSPRSARRRPGGGRSRNPRVLRRADVVAWLAGSSPRRPRRRSRWLEPSARRGIKCPRPRARVARG